MEAGAPRAAPLGRSASLARAVAGGAQARPRPRACRSRWLAGVRMCRTCCMAALA